MQIGDHARLNWGESRREGVAGEREK